MSWSRRGPRRKGCARAPIGADQLIRAVADIGLIAAVEPEDHVVAGAADDGRGIPFTSLCNMYGDADTLVSLGAPLNLPSGRWPGNV